MAGPARKPGAPTKTKPLGRQTMERRPAKSVTKAKPKKKYRAWDRENGVSNIGEY